jgi:hypothetical protein
VGQETLETLVARLGAAGHVKIPARIDGLDDPMVNASTPFRAGVFS